MSEYEFTEQQNQVLDGLSGALRRLAIVIAVFAAVLVAFGAVPDASRSIFITIGIIGAGVLSLVMAYLFMQPLDNFRRITTTKGKDLSEFLTALDHLNKAHNMFRLILILLVLAQSAGVVAKMMS